MSNCLLHQAVVPHEADWYAMSPVLSVACLELWQPEAEVFISNALSMLPYTGA